MARRTIKKEFKPEFKFEDTAIVLLRTSFLNYQMAIYLNNTFGLHLRRMQQDMESPNGPHAYYCHEDEVKRITYTLIDKAQSSTQNKLFQYYDMVLLIRGADALAVQAQLYQEAKFGSAEPDPMLIHSHRRWVISNEMKSGIFDIDYFDFSQEGVTNCSIPTQIKPDLIRKRAMLINDLKNDISAIFKHLEYSINFEKPETYTPNELEMIEQDEARRANAKKSGKGKVFVLEF